MYAAITLPNEYSIHFNKARVFYKTRTLPNLYLELRSHSRVGEVKCSY